MFEYRMLRTLSKLMTSFFFFNDTATTEIYTLSLHDALPICPLPGGGGRPSALPGRTAQRLRQRKRLHRYRDPAAVGTGPAVPRAGRQLEIGRASCRERV